MTESRKRRIEFGDFQTPDDLAAAVCRRLVELGIRPRAVIEPTCGVGAFVVAAARAFADAKEIVGYEINGDYLDVLRSRLGAIANPERIRLESADFFATDWAEQISRVEGPALVLGNLPWVTSAVLGSIGGTNLPVKSNFLGHKGLDAITGKANFDISEWMLLEVLKWFEGKAGDLAMLVKTAVARKILAHAERQQIAVRDAFVIGIDAKRFFAASVEACLLVMRFSADKHSDRQDYTVFESLTETTGRRVGHRNGLTVGNLAAFETASYLVGASPKKWRSGVKHDASSVMEFTRTGSLLCNGLGETAELESTYLYPLLKGSDIGSNKQWREKYVLVTQTRVGEETSSIELNAPKTWRYLDAHGKQLDARGSTIYAKNARFSVFGIGDYAFRPWKIAICALYKALRFRLVGPIGGRPVMFDDTVNFISFDTEAEAREVLDLVESPPARDLLSSLIFWDEKRPIKASILNTLDWTKLAARDELAMGTTTCIG